MRFGIGQIHDFLLPSMSNPSNNGFYLFGATEGWAVAQNIFLDGNTFSDNHSVDKENWVGEVSLGIGWHTERLDGHINHAIKRIQTRCHCDLTQFYRTLLADSRDDEEDPRVGICLRHFLAERLISS